MRRDINNRLTRSAIFPSMPARVIQPASGSIPSAAGLER
jgi:hypothetical protein